jgi:large subunit ribosomal protein L2
MKKEKVEIYKGRPIKGLSVALIAVSGRNNRGKITVRARGGGHKKRYRIVDFFRNMINVMYKVLRFEYDPNRTAYLALLSYENGFVSYVLASEFMNVGLLTLTGGANVSGNLRLLSDINIGQTVYSVEDVVGMGGKFGRAAGAKIKLLRKQAGYVYSKLPSGEIRLVSEKAAAVLGTCSNVALKFKELHKAGENRWRGLRPNVRGVAKNPVDHPHGGGQGKTKGGRCSVSPWGRLTKGKKTRSPRKNNSKIIKSRANGI